MPGPEGDRPAPEDRERGRGPEAGARHGEDRLLPVEEGPQALIVVAHRGFHRDVPENTVEAFERAVALGVDGIETDVRLSADGAAVLFHDRVAPGGASVAEATREDLARAAGHPVPTLEEALRRFPEVLWMVEVKAPAAGDAVVRALRGVDRRRVLVTSFDHPLALDLASRASVDGGVIVSHRPLPGPDPPLGLPPTPGPLRHVVLHYATLDGEVVDRLARAGYRSWVYGVLTAEEHARCLALPLEGIVTDRPDRL